MDGYRQRNLALLAKIELADMNSWVATSQDNKIVFVFSKNQTLTK